MSHFPGLAEATVSSALQAALRPGGPQRTEKSRLIVAGATGVLGAEVLRRLAGSGRFAHTDVLAREPITAGLPSVGIQLAGGDAFEQWPVLAQPVQVAVVMFEPPRAYHDRERALWTPGPQQLVGLAHWLKRCGVRTLVVVVPHAQGGLPQALKRGLANLDEQAVAAVGFERMLLVRAARKAASEKPCGYLSRAAAWMLDSLKYMIPATEQPVRPALLAEFVDAALQVLPAGTHVAPPELLWQFAQTPRAARSSTATPNNAAQGTSQAVVRAWLNTTPD